MKKRLLSLLLIAVLLTGITPACRAADDDAAEVDPTPQPAPEAVGTVLPPAAEPAAQPAVEAYTVTRYITPEGWDLSDIRSRRYTGAPVRFPAAVEMLGEDLADAMERICRAAEAEEVFIRYNNGAAPAYWDILADVAAVFLVENGTIRPEDAAGTELTETDVTLLRQIFWDMVCLNPVLRETEICSGETDENGQAAVWRETLLQINVDSRSLSEISAGWTGEQQALLDAFLSESARNPLKSICRGGFVSAEAQLEALGVCLSEDLDPVRRQVVLSACSLAGRVPYFWGGKSESVGWDARWGVPAVITSAGNWKAETIRPFGLDCSGLVSWAFINGAGDAGALAYIGHGTDVQFSRCQAASLQEARPGDVAFAVEADGTVSHVGVVVGRNAAGELLVCHCSGGGDNIVVEPMSLSGCNTVGLPGDFYSVY